MEFVLLGYGAKAIFRAGDKDDAIRIARRLAVELRLSSWLLYDKSLTLIASE